MLFRVSEYTRDISMRYTQDNTNKELLDKSLNDFKLQVSIEDYKEKEDKMNK